MTIRTLVKHKAYAGLRDAFWPLCEVYKPWRRVKGMPNGGYYDFNRTARQPRTLPLSREAKTWKLTTCRRCLARRGKI